MSKRDDRRDPSASSRREFLKRALKGAAYAAPVVVAMSMRKVAAQQPSNPGNMYMKGMP